MDYAITSFFESKGLTVDWVPEIVPNNFLFTTRIEYEVEKIIYELYERFKEHYQYANHVELMYSESQYLSAFPLHLGTKYTHDKDITKFFVNKGLNVNWFPKFSSHNFWYTTNVENEKLKPVNKIINALSVLFEEKYTRLDLMYHIYNDVSYLWFRFE